MTSETTKSKNKLNFDIKDLPDYSEHNREKINKLILNVKEKGKLNDVSKAISKARTCMRIIDVLQSALQKRFRSIDRQNF